MAQELVPIKVKIGLRSNGHADHPNWTRLPMINSDNEVKQYTPSGWIYDKDCGHKEERSENNQWDSPYGMQWGCLLVTPEFAKQAVETYPDRINELTEAEFEDFFDNRSRIRMLENNRDSEILQSLKSELDLRKNLKQNTTELETKIVKALDPNDKEPGVIKNDEKYWKDYRDKKGFIIKK